MPDSLDWIFETPASYTAQEEIRALPRMLMEGTAALHRDRSKWLAPYEQEETVCTVAGGMSDYDVRVGRAVVEPFYQRAVERAVATCMGKQIRLRDDVPDVIRGTGEDSEGAQHVEGWWENIDQRGNDGNVFLRGAVEDAEGDAGYSTVLVDHPPVPPGFTQADLERTGMRPYWVHYKARDVMEAVPELVNGRQRLKEVRLRECGPKDEERIRLIKAAPWDEASQSLVGWVTWELWEKQKDKDGNTVIVSQGTGDMQPHQEIPLAPLYFKRTGFFQARPPFELLGWLNLKHTRQDSDISEDLRLSCGATLHRFCSPEEAKQPAIGPRRLLWSEKEGATAQWLERSGSAARVFMEFQDALEAKMERVAGEPHIRRTGSETATAAAIDSAKVRTEMQVQAYALKDFTETLLTLTAMYRQFEHGGSVDVFIPPAFEQRDIDRINVLVSAADKGYIQPFRVAEALRLQALLPEDVDAEAEAEAAKQSAPAPVADPNAVPGQPDAAARVKAAVAAAVAGEGGAQGGSRSGQQATPPPGNAGAGQQADQGQPATAA